jgi:hypothetical protein
MHPVWLPAPTAQVTVTWRFAGCTVRLWSDGAMTIGPDQ